MLNSIAADDPDAPPRIAALAQGLQELGWTIGRNVRIDYRWGASDAEQTVVLTSSFAALHRDLIIGLATRLRLPAIYPYRFFVAGGGLISYGPDLVDQYRFAASYVDRILKGEKPVDLPVQAPTKRGGRGV